MVRLLVMQFDTNIFGVFARIGYMAGEMFISHESTRYAHEISESQANAIVRYARDQKTIYLGDSIYEVCGIDYAVA